VNDNFLKYYNKELRHIRETANEFSQQYPKIAGRLGIETLEVADPYVERLLEGFAFMAARVQLKIDAKHPELTQQLMNIIYPHYQAQTPSCAIVQFTPISGEGSLLSGFDIDNHTQMWSRTGNDKQATPCQFRTTQNTTLWPIELSGVKYFSSNSALSAAGWHGPEKCKAGIRFQLSTQPGIDFSQLPIDELVLHIAGEDDLPIKLYEQIFANGLGYIIKDKSKPESQGQFFSADHIEQSGFEDEEALLPYPDRSFQGYRLLQEYFTFPKRFLFFKFTALRKFLKDFSGSDIEITILLDKSHSELTTLTTQDQFKLFCTPAINLFQKNSERVRLEKGQYQYHISPDRTRPMDFEIYRVDKVRGYKSGAQTSQSFLPFYGHNDHVQDHLDSGFFTTIRKPRKHSSQQKRLGARSNSYLGSEIHLSIVDSNNAPFQFDLKQLGVDLLCTNRDLPLHMPTGRGNTDFTLETGAPIECIKVITGPSTPIQAKPPSEISWQFVNQLSLNYLSLCDSDEGADKIRQLLRLYSNSQNPSIEKQIEAIKKIRSKPINRQLMFSDKVAYCRGLEIELECDESGFEGQGIYLLGAVLEKFFSKYVSINSFTQLTLTSTRRGKIHTWPPKVGGQPIL
jgi:type VI secretion system protein ImpG